MNESRNDLPDVTEINHDSNNGHTRVDKETLLSIPGIGRQFYAAFVVCVVAFASGTTEGWSSPMVLILGSKESPIPRMTGHETNQIVVQMKLTSIANTIVAGFISDRFGRRSSAWAATVLAPIGWALLASATSKNSLNIGVILIGTTSVSGLIVGVILLSEIADDRIRGTVISILVFCYSCGTLASHVFGEVCSYDVFQWSGFTISILSAILIYTLPESPQFLVLRNRLDDARKSMEWYNGNDSAVVEDKMSKLNASKVIIDCQKFVECKGQRRSIVIIIFLNALSELCGTTIIETYSGIILREVAEPGAITPGLGSLILACFRFIAGLTSCYLIERSGRKLPLTFSLIQMAFTLLVLSVLVIFKNRGFTLQIYVPLVCLIFYTLANQIYLGTNEVISGEITSPDVKGLIMAVGGVCKIIVSILCLQLYTTLHEVGSYSNYIYEAAFCIIGALGTMYSIPETGGKTLCTIRDELRGVLAKPGDGVIPIHRKSIKIDSSDKSTV